MPNTTQTEQRIQILQRSWKKYIITILGIYFLLMVLFVYSSSNATVRSVIFSIGTTAGFSLIGKRAARRFARQLPPEDRTLVVNQPRRFSKGLAKACKDDTLPRATHSTETTPQDQLLRPSRTDEN